MKFDLWVAMDFLVTHTHIAHFNLWTACTCAICQNTNCTYRGIFIKKRGWFQSIFLSILQLQLLVTLPKKGCMHAHRTHISKVIWYTPKTCGSVGTHCKYKYVYPISTKGISYVTLTTGNSFSVYLKFL